jgi:hypothetical protein
MRAASRPHARALIALIAALGLAPARPAAADAWIVHEVRSEDLGATPSLGRGYTPAISSYHGVCFDSLPTTRASFDFDYVFEDLESLTASRSRRPETLRAYEVDDFIARNSATTAVVTSKQTRYVHYLFAALVVDSYYSSIDEAHATLGKAARELLRAGDTVSFFAGCGTFYIRSIARRSYFLTLFSYITTDRTRDVGFELKLEQAVRKVGGAAPAPAPPPAGKPAPAPARPTRAEPEFDDQARTRELKLVTRSIGLVAQGESTLLPFDLASYQDSVKQAFKASQDEFTGRVTSMEIMPWLSNAEVATLLGAGTTDHGSWTERKRILGDNAEFYVELSNYLLEIQSLLHKGEACRRALEDRVYDGGQLRPEYASAVAINHATGERAPLATLLAAVAPANLDRMRAIGEAIRDGADGTSGAAACMRALEAGNLGAQYHGTIPACAWTRGNLPGAQIVREFCQPELEGVAAMTASPLPPSPAPSAPALAAPASAPAPAPAAPAPAPAPPAPTAP